MDQGTEAWKRERAGKATASRMADIMARTKSGYGASRGNYLAELVAERPRLNAGERQKHMVSVPLPIEVAL